MSRAIDGAFGRPAAARQRSTLRSTGTHSSSSPKKARIGRPKLPGAGEEFPFSPGLSVFKVAGKIFALSRLDELPLSVSLKCEPELAEQFRATYAAIRPGYHLNKRHWNTVDVDGSLPDQLVLDMVEDSYDLVVAGLPKRLQDDLGWPPG